MTIDSKTLDALLSEFGASDAAFRRAGFTQRQIFEIAKLGGERHGLVPVCVPCGNERFAANDLLRRVATRMKNVVVSEKICGIESAQNSVLAAFAGKLVFSPMQAQDAADCVAKLMRFGIRRETLFSVLRGIIVQERVKGSDGFHLLTDIALVKRGAAFVHYSNVANEILKSLKKLPPPNCAKKERNYA